LNPEIFIASLISSIIGVVLDNWTTRKFISDIGIAYESNAFVRTVLERWGLKVWLVFETIPVLMFSFFDFFFDILFLGVLYGVVRGLAGAHNFQITRAYRTIGVDTWNEHVKWIEQQYNKVARNGTAKLRLDYLMFSLLCFVATVLILSTPDVKSSFLLVLAAGLILGIGGFFLNVIVHESS
jgi:hypothetical protein